MTKGGKENKKTKKKAVKTSLKVKVIKKPKKTKAVKKTKKPAVVKKEASEKKRVKRTAKKKAKTPVRPTVERKEDQIVPRIIEEKVEREKLFIIRVAVTFCMAVVVMVWIYTLKTTIEDNKHNNSKGEVVENLRLMSDTVAEKIDQINTDLKKVDNFGSKTEEDSEGKVEKKVLSFEEASSSIPLLIEKINEKDSLISSSTNQETSSTSPDVDDIEELKRRIEELENKLLQ